MRQLLFLITCFYSFGAEAQNCKANINVTVKICGSKLATDSLCQLCNNCLPGLKASDSSFSIISYTVTADRIGFDEGVEEIFNTGASFNEAKRILAKVRPGSYVEFSCIKAKDRRGSIYILQPLIFTVK